MLKLHNDARRKVSTEEPLAKDGKKMPKGTVPDMVWDEDLAKRAQV